MKRIRIIKQKPILATLLSWIMLFGIFLFVELNVCANSESSIRGTDSFIHIDTDSGTTFVVPAGWKQKEFTKDREFIDAKFVANQDEGCVIIFGSNDAWGQLSDADKKGCNREDINNEAFTMSDIAEMYGTTAEDISLVTYNGVEYYKGEIVTSLESYGIEGSFVMTQLVHIHNGWMYMFQFGGSSDHKLYSDFESVLNSVEYMTSKNVPTKDSFNNSWVLLCLFIFVVVAVVSIWILRTKINAKDSSINNGYPTAYCEKCGIEMPLDSEFCHVCGTRINQEEK